MVGVPMVGALIAGHWFDLYAKARTAGIFCLLLWVSGCAQWPGFGKTQTGPTHQLVLKPPPEQFNLEGRVSVRTGENSFSGGMAWQHSKQQEILLLSTPLGQGVAELRGEPGKVSLKDAEGREYQARDAEALVKEVTGMTLPITGLSWWVVGHPQPGTKFEAEADSMGRLSVLHQADWRIEFSRYALQGNAMLPGRLLARRGEDLEIRLVVDSWVLP